MNTVKYALALLALGLVMIGANAYAQLQAAITVDFKQPAANLITGGPPSQAQLLMLKEAGVTKVINLLGPDETMAFDEKAEVEALGLKYNALPISGPTDITVDNAKALYQLLQGSDKVFVHCASGNRVGALLAIGAHEVEGKSVVESLAFGQAAGLGSLEQKVQEVLSGQNGGRN
ncbi:hypothetical protein [Arsukibacterium sp.]|uniref:hypothetical protein n=1 Tax=Arsukibacterium sp. TaxID=1977258 RepID=UPI001BD375D7|nr:hypothetical protein [Arsukibacterium sp.]